MFKIVYFLLPALALASPLAPELSDAKIQRLESLLESPATTDLEAAEKRYQKLVERQTFSDLLLLYSPENENRLKIAYPSFTPAAAVEPGLDLGFGFHVVKRLELPLENGQVKIIEVNEQWPENPLDAGLLLPDEIRVKTLYKDGPREIPGSEKNYLFDSIRLAWGPDVKTPELARQSRYRFQKAESKNTFKQMHSAVSAPFSCIKCHRPQNKVALHFLAEGETRNFESIVQPGYYRVQPQEMLGYKQYIDYLRTRKEKSDPFIQAVEQKLQNPASAFAVAGLTEKISELLKSGQSLTWLNEDSRLDPSFGFRHPGQHGVYTLDSKKWFLESLDNLIEGKYRWWNPNTVIP